MARNGDRGPANIEIHGGLAVTSFVGKLYEMVMHDHSGVVCFIPDGSAFEVKDPRKLELEVLPKFFRHSRFQSFVRQLCFYNFKKISKERSIWVYKHDKFHRDRPELLTGLKRKTNTTSMERPSPSGRESMKTNYSRAAPSSTKGASRTQRWLAPLSPQVPGLFAGSLDNASKRTQPQPERAGRLPCQQPPSRRDSRTESQGREPYFNPRKRRAEASERDSGLNMSVLCRVASSSDGGNTTCGSMGWSPRSSEGSFSGSYDGANGDSAYEDHGDDESDRPRKRMSSSGFSTDSRTALTDEEGFSSSGEEDEMVALKLTRTSSDRVASAFTANIHSQPRPYTAPAQPSEARPSPPVMIVRRKPWPDAAPTGVSRQVRDSLAAFCTKVQPQKYSAHTLCEEVTRFLDGQAHVHSDFQRYTSALGSTIGARAFLNGQVAASALLRFFACYAVGSMDIHGNTNTLAETQKLDACRSLWLQAAVSFT